MIEMEKTNSKKGSIPVKRKKGKKGAQEINIVQSRFYDELRFAETEELHLEFDELVKSIAAEGERFAKNPTHESLKKYKSMIKDFLEYVTDRMFGTEHHTGGRMKQKVYTITRIIDKKLHNLTNYILSQQSQNLDLLSTLDEIRGLLIDLYK